MNGICKTLDCFFGAQFDPSDDKWRAIQVYRDGNTIHLGGPFDTEEEAEDFAGAAASARRELQLAMGAS